MIHTQSPASSTSFSSIKTGLKQALRQRTGIHFRNESKFTSPVPEVQITFLFFFSHSLFFIFRECFTFLNALAENGIHLSLFSREPAKRNKAGVTFKRVCESLEKRPD